MGHPDGPSDTAAAPCRPPARQGAAGHRAARNSSSARLNSSGRSTPGRWPAPSITVSRACGARAHMPSASATGVYTSSAPTSTRQGTVAGSAASTGR